MAKQLVGIVSSDKADKTITVTVSTRKTHPIYKKQYSVSTKFLAHDEKNEAATGDKVAIVETRPRSARKRFELLKVIEKPVLREEDLKVEAEAAVQAVTEKPKKPAVEPEEEASK
jgi:small subunit ribosomal protein S17